MLCRLIPMPLRSARVDAPSKPWLANTLMAFASASSLSNSLGRATDKGYQLKTILSRIILGSLRRRFEERDHEVEKRADLGRRHVAREVIGVERKPLFGPARQKLHQRPA